ncbi:mitochondrial outer membrane protein porin 2-like [Populus alba x Populus x berolinensis]|uniref:Mitochondrial outer membrane protein porin 2-like n=1 Tax=Populus alba x Populus x berolinensis TaxID=444605 RepID=A0AAD6VV83_9ROSI|nr:mitochondrial outer membrane protein porin 2-like [Populus alba x Populus x berolinensis]
MYKNTIFNVQIDTESNISTTLTFTGFLPSTKTIASIKFPDYNSGKLEVQYFHDRASFTTAVALNQSPAIDVTATIGTPTMAFGAEAGYDTTLGSFTKYTAGISVTKPDSYASMILGDKGDSLRASYVHHLDLLKKSAVAGEITRSHGKLGALVQHEVIPKSVLTISSEVDTKALDKSPSLLSSAENFNFGLMGILANCIYDPFLMIQWRLISKSDPAANILVEISFLFPAILDLRLALGVLAMDQPSIRTPEWY